MSNIDTNSNMDSVINLRTTAETTSLKLSFNGIHVTFLRWSWRSSKSCKIIKTYVMKRNVILKNCRDINGNWYKNAIDDDDDELFLWYGWPTKGVSPYFQPGPLAEILTIANLRHTQAGFEPVQNLSLGLVKWNCAVVITTTPWCHYTTTPWCHFTPMGWRPQLAKY